MSKKLSAVAQLQIVRLLGEANGYLWYTGACGKLPSEWEVLAHLYLSNLAEPPESYLRSRELAMILKDAVSEEDLSFIFSHGQPLVFLACPNRLVPKLIEAFQQLNEEPSFLHATIMPGNAGTIEVLPPLYVDCFPCTACCHDATVQPSFRHEMANACDGNSKCVVETIHIRSNLITKQLSIELYYMTVGHFYGYARPETASDNAHKFWSPVKAILVLVDDPACGVAASPLSQVTSRRTTTMLVPEFAVEVYGFLDRIHVGASLLSNRRMHDCLTDARGILPVHQLSCELDRENLGYDHDIGQAYRSGTHYQLILHQFQRDLPYNDTRQFELCDVISPKEECALALRYLSNSYVVGFGDRRCYDADHLRFFLRMLGALAGRNVSAGRVELDHFEGCVRDYRTLDRAFGGQLPIMELRVRLQESSFVGLAKITDFFRYSGVQRLKELCLTLHDPWNESPPRMGPTPNPLWMDGITRLLNCEKYEVHYTGRRIPSAVRSRIVQVCEKFERDEISETVKHFALCACSTVEVEFPFNSDNLMASRANVTAENRRAYVARYEWDVYHFRNAVTSKSLSALVGHGRAEAHGTVLHLLRGDVGPEALLTFRASC